mgnify:CR=1 FL=1
MTHPLRKDSVCNLIVRLKDVHSPILRLGPQNRQQETEAEETTAADTIEDESRRLQDGDEADEPEAPEEEKKEAAIVTASPAGPSELYVKKEFSDVAFSAWASSAT